VGGWGGGCGSGCAGCVGVGVGVVGVSGCGEGEGLWEYHRCCANEWCTLTHTFFACIFLHALKHARVTHTSKHTCIHTYTHCREGVPTLA
jgi:hypothetical protein